MRAKIQKRSEAPQSARRSTLPMDPNGSGRMTAAVPRMKNALNMHDPMTLPMASPGRPLIAATIDAASSGSDVPMATMVSPMRASLTPRAAAIPEAPATNRSPPAMSPASPAMTSSEALAIGICGFCAAASAAGSSCGCRIDLACANV